MNESWNIKVVSSTSDCTETRLCRGSSLLEVHGEVVLLQDIFCTFFIVNTIDLAQRIKHTRGEKTQKRKTRKNMKTGGNSLPELDQFQRNPTTRQL